MFLRRPINLLRAFLLDFYTRSDSGGLVSRLRIFFGLPRTPEVATAVNLNPREAATFIVPTPSPNVVTATAPAPPTAVPFPTVVSSPVAGFHTDSRSAMHATAAAAFRQPMIKFLGARLPRPHYDSSKFPPLQIVGFPSGSAPQSTTAKASSIGPVGKIPRGHGIEESQLPARYRRPLISEEECIAINNGGAYGL